MLHLGNVPAGSTLYIPFATYNSSGASVTMTNFAVTDIEIYKDGSVTQRASDNGYTLLDTDGTDFDGITGIHGFSVDLSDNTTAGFYAAGSFYWVVVSSVTADGQTVNFIAATFRIVAAESVAGTPKADVSHFGGSAGTFASGRPEVNTSHIAGSAVSTSAAQIGVNVVNAGSTAWGSGAITAASIAADAITAAKIADGAIDAATFAAGAITAAAIATDAIDADAIAADAVTEIQSGLSTLDAAGVRTAVGLASANLDTQLTAIDDFLDTEVAAILEDTGTTIPAQIAALDGSAFTAIPWNAAWDAEVQSEVTDALNAYDPPTNAELEARTLVAADYATATAATAIKAKTDSLTFTVAGQVDANIQSVNDVTVTGTGASGDEWGA
jgi:hypothetical protein